jgi:hypothetical protein
LCINYPIYHLIKEFPSSLDWAKGVFVCVLGEGGPLGGCQLLVSIRGV